MASERSTFRMTLARYSGAIGRPIASAASSTHFAISGFFSVIRLPRAQYGRNASSMPSTANHDGCNPRGASLERIMTIALDLGVHALRAAYRGGTLTCRKVVDEVLARIAEAGDDKVWIARMPDEALRDIAAALDGRRGEIEQLPLYGVPFAVKDNIDVAGLGTTAACPGFAYMPDTTA